MSTINIDKDRFLIKEASTEKITGKWKEVVQEIIKTFNAHLGSNLISVYIGGSVAHGKALENKSDVDSYAIVNLTAEEIEEARHNWVKEERKRIDSMFPFQRGVELHLIPQHQISEGKKFQMKVFSTWVYGKDFSEELSQYKLDKETLGRIRVNPQKDIELAKKELIETAVSNSEEIKRISKWISKRLIRNTGMMCMWRGDFFTMDISALVKIITLYYPEEKQAIERLFEYTENPPSNKQIMFDIFDSFGEWLIEEDKKVFSESN